MPTPAFIGRSPSRRCRLMRRGIIRCGVAATVSIAAISWVQSAAGQVSGPAAGRSDNDAESNLPDTAGVVAGFMTARRWIDAFDLPKADAAAGAQSLPGASCVCVILRRSGRVMGIGTDATADALMLRRAIASAMNQVLADPALARISAQLQADEHRDPETALRLDSVHSEIGRSLSLELEVGGKLTPLVGRTVRNVAMRIEPAVNGAAVRRGQSWEHEFPSRMRTANLGGDPVQTLTSLAVRSGVSLNEVDAAAARDELVFYRFSSIALAQNAPGAAPFQLFRGDTIVSQAAATPEAIAACADDMARHLLESMWPSPPERELQKPLGIMGDYSVVADQYRPLVAPPLHQALAAFALQRYALSPGVDQANAGAAKTAALHILQDLAVVSAGEDDPLEDPAACAAVMYAVAEDPKVLSDPAVEKLFSDAARRVAESFDPAGGFVRRPTKNDQSQSAQFSSHEQAMLAGAMSRLLIVPGPSHAVDPAWVRKAIDAAWQSAAPSQHVALLPWIGWAEADYSVAAKRPLAHQEELRQLIEVLGRTRIGSPRFAGASGGALGLEMRGGFALSSQTFSADAAPQATAQTVRPASWLAGVLNDPRLVPLADRDAELADHMLTMRFLMQLTVRESTAGQVRNPKRALGGVREALWDSDEPLAASALGLITASDSVRIVRPVP